LGPSHKELHNENLLNSVLSKKPIILKCFIFYLYKDFKNLKKNFNI